MIVFLRLASVFLIALSAMSGIQWGLVGDLKVNGEPIDIAGRVFCVLLGFVLSMCGMACHWADEKIRKP